MSKTEILDAAGVSARLQRMAFEVYEQNFAEKEVILLGIAHRGGFLATQLAKRLKNISPLSVSLAGANLDREERQGKGGLMEVDFSESPAFFAGKSVVVVDDVLYSGNTLLNVIAPLLNFQPSKIQTAILIDRGHRTMPVFSNIVGIELATSIQQHVFVEVNEQEGSAVAWLE